MPKAGWATCRRFASLTEAGRQNGKANYYGWGGLRNPTGRLSGRNAFGTESPRAHGNNARRGRGRA